MTRKRRLLKIAKWTALTLFVVSLAAWVAAVNYLCAYLFCGTFVGTDNGYYVIGSLPSEPPQLPWPFVSDSKWPRTMWFNERAYDSRSWLRATISYIPEGSMVGIPAWYPIVPLLLATIVLFYADRRRIPPGHCRCGYNLTGNTTGRCPECGTEIGGVKS